MVLPYFGYGGAEQMVSVLCAAIDLERFDLRVYCIYGKPQHNPLEQRVRDAGVPIVFLRKGLGFSLKAVAKLYRELSAFRPDVVHSHLGACLYCVPWILTHRPKLLHTIHNVPEREAGSRLRQDVMRLLYRSRQGVPVAISGTNAGFVAHFYGLATSRVQMIENPVNVEAFAGLSRRKGSTSGTSDRFTFINVARLSEAKNQNLLLTAFSEVVNDYPQARLAIVGGGPLEGSLRERIDELGLAESVCLLGVRDDIAELLHESDVFVLSSDTEGLPLSVLEAMAAGLPVIATRVGGLEDLVQGNGILVDRADKDALAGAMKDLLRDDERRATMARRSRELVQRFDAAHIARKYEQLYAVVGQPHAN